MNKIKNLLVVLTAVFLFASPVTQQDADAREFYDLRKAERHVVLNDEGEQIGVFCIFCDPKGICVVISCVGQPIIRI